MKSRWSIFALIVFGLGGGGWLGWSIAQYSFPTPPSATVSLPQTNRHLLNTNVASGYRTVTATFFWVGEQPTADNAYIANVASAWDGHWQDHFGGVDLGTDRCGYYPCSFTPQENPFYVALPYNDLTEQGQRKSSARRIPWFAAEQEKKSVLKNHWVEVRVSGRSCYGQWEDVGPFESDDVDYVFGTAEPKNQFNQKAGIDLSPAMRDCLGMKDNGLVEWQFVDDESVPAGPWSAIVTTSAVRW